MKRSDPVVDAVESVLNHIEAFIMLVYPGEMTPQAKRMLEQIIEQHRGNPYLKPFDHRPESGDEVTDVH